MNTFAGSESINTRHHYIHENQVEGLFGSQCERCFATICAVGSAKNQLDGSGDGTKRDRVIIHNEEADGIAKIGVGISQAEVVEQPERGVRSVQGRRGAKFRVLHEFRQHSFKSVTESENPTQFSALSLQAQHIGANVHCPEESSEVTWIGSLPGRLQLASKPLERG